MNKIAYPQDSFGNTVENPRNLQKWMSAMEQMYTTASTLGWPGAFDSITSGWDDMEKLDFKQWVKFYQENAHSKYKTAQFIAKYIENGPGSFIPMDAIKASLPKPPDMTGFDQQRELDATKLKEEQERVRKELVVEKLRALISRLSSAEKISTLPDVQRELNKVLPEGVTKWFAALQELKREIQLVPIRSASDDIIGSLIQRNVNRLIASGDTPAAKLLVKIAQMVSTPGPSNPMGVPSMNPIDTTMGGQPVGISEGPPNIGEGPLGGPVVGNPENESDPAKNKTMQDFIKLLSSPDDTNDVSESDDELVVTDKDLPTLKTTAQAVTSEAPAPQENIEPIAQESLPKDVTDISVLPDVGDSTQDPFDQALANVQVSDIISRLEGIASMFKNRQVARQLSVIDLMMDKIGIAPFFPTLAESMRSALESNQYCQSRIEEILAKLRGTVATPMSQQIEGEVSGANTNNEETIKANLAKDEATEKARKEHRKQQNQIEEDAAMEPQTPAPQAPNPSQELAGPVNVQKAPINPNMTQKI